MFENSNQAAWYKTPLGKLSESNGAHRTVSDDKGFQGQQFKMGRKPVKLNLMGSGLVDRVDKRGVAYGLTRLSSAISRFVKYSPTLGRRAVESTTRGKDECTKPYGR